jgi:hypothetical protein
MAEDLIPPPSPAGRPEPDSSAKAAERHAGASPSGGGGLWGPGSSESEGSRMRPGVAMAVADPGAASEAARAEAEALAAARPVASPYRSRFAIIAGILGGLGVAALAAAVIAVASSSGSGVPDHWSTWKPTTRDPLVAAKQIADHVGEHYRLGDGDQLVAVAASGLEVSDIPLHVALRTAANGGDIKLLDGDGVMYTLNGLGPRGSIPSGTPSVARHLLLRREALELALYTFRYAKHVDMVVTLLPPPPDEATASTPPPTQAIFYRPGDLEPELEVPLTSTIAPATPRPETLSTTAPASMRIDELTRGNLFEASFQQGQNGSAYLVLRRPAG